MGTRLRQHPGASWFALLLAAAIVLVAVFSKVEVFHKGKTPPRTTNAALRLGPGNPATQPGDPIRAGATATVISTGDYQTCALFSGGNIDCWGDGAHGQLGDGEQFRRLAPVRVRGLAAPATSLSVGGSHACAVLIDGSVACWGSGAHGDLGDGLTTDAPTPRRVHAIHNAVAVAAGAAHTCALLLTGKIDCWGANSNGQLGDGTTRDSSTPVPVKGVSGAAAIAAGLAHTCALRSSGDIDCWGANTNGELGDGKTIDSSRPVHVRGIDGAVAIAAGDAHTCAVRLTGSVECWGWNIEGQLGNGVGDSAVPVQVPELRNAKAISAGGNDTCTLLRRGRVICWGANLDGQLGNGTTSDSATPVTVSGLGVGVTAVTTGVSQSCALLSGGSITCWGSGAQGQLGDGSRAASSSPVAVAGLGLAPDGSGTIEFTPAAVPSQASHVTVELSYSAAPGGVYQGELELVVPRGWSLPSRIPDASGFVTASSGHLDVSGRIVRITHLSLAGGSLLTVHYGDTTHGGPGAKIGGGGTASWNVREESSATGTLAPLAASTAIAVLSPNGSGALAVAPATVASGRRVKRLSFVYTADRGGLRNGVLVLKVPPGWSPPTGVRTEPGFVSASRGRLSVGGRTVTVSGLSLRGSQRVTLEYSGGTAPSANVGAQTWRSYQRSGANGKLAPIGAAPAVVVLSANGSGRITVNQDAVPNGARHLALTFTYTADTGGMKKGAVALHIPSGWPAPSKSPLSAGYVASHDAHVSVAGRTVVLSVRDLASDGAITATYGSRDRGGPGVSAPVGLIGTQVIRATERSTPGATMRALNEPPTITVLAPDGTGALARATGDISPGSHGNTVAYVFTAARGGMVNGRVGLTVPPGWSSPSLKPTDPGYVTASPGVVAVQGHSIVVYGLTLRERETVTIIYGSRAAGGLGAVAPAAITAGVWSAKEESSLSGSLKRLP